jgi:hypothetical protein
MDSKDCSGCGNMPGVSRNFAAGPDTTRNPERIGPAKLIHEFNNLGIVDVSGAKLVAVGIFGFPKAGIAD